MKGGREGEGRDKVKEGRRDEQRNGPTREE